MTIESPRRVRRKGKRGGIYRVQVKAEGERERARETASESERDSK